MNVSRFDTSLYDEYESLYDEQTIKDAEQKLYDIVGHSTDSFENPTELQVNENGNPVLSHSFDSTTTVYLEIHIPDKN